MAELINSNVFDVNKKFVDFAGLDYFWENAKGYIDNIDVALTSRVNTNAGAISSIRGQLESLTTGGAGSIQSQISAAIEALKLAETYDSKGAAAKALEDAKAYVDGMKITEAIATAKSEANTYADGLNTAMDTRVKVLEAIDHEKLASDASAAAVATVLDGAPEKFDTLKEIAQWISDNESAESAADLVNRVKALEDVDADNRLDVLEGRDVYVAQDVTNAIATAKSEAIAKAATDAATAYESRIATLEGQDVYVEETVSASINKAKEDAIAAAATAAATAYESRIATLEGQDVYVEETVSASINKAKEDAIAAANETLKSYYKKTEVDGLLSTNSQADQLYAKTYTDELFNSIKFASRDDIDGLFNVGQVPA